MAESELVLLLQTEESGSAQLGLLFVLVVAEVKILLEEVGGVMDLRMTLCGDTSDARESSSIS